MTQKWPVNYYYYYYYYYYSTATLLSTTLQYIHYVKAFVYTTQTKSRKKRRGRGRRWLLVKYF
jgi:hypothetical protein